MLREAERLKTEEAAANVARRQRAAALLSEVAAANAEQITRKAVALVREREEEAAIAQYLAAKDAHEAVRGRGAEGGTGGCVPWAREHSGCDLERGWSLTLCTLTCTCTHLSGAGGSQGAAGPGARAGDCPPAGAAGAYGRPAQ